MKIYKQTS